MSAPPTPTASRPGFSTPMISSALSMASTSSSRGMNMIWRFEAAMYSSQLSWE